MTEDELVSGVRTMVRDYPQYFEVDEGPLNVLTVRLPHPLISGKTVQVYVTDETLTPPQTTMTSSWQLDERNGLLKILDASLLNQRIIVTGYHYSWFADSDLAFHLGHVLDEMNYSGNSTIYEPMQWDVIMLGGVVQALWALAMELSLDIDVSTPEGMFIPARQRYTQIMQMVAYYDKQYTEKASLMNMGLGSLEVFQLRRVAYLSGRFVPVYRNREFDDPRPPERLYPSIPEGTPPIGLEVSTMEAFEQTIFTPADAPALTASVVVAGEDEVAVQPDEPTNPTVVLWVDTDA